MGLARETQRIPPALQAKPEIPLHLALYWEAFQALSPSRPATGFAVGAIPISEIVAWADTIGLQDPEARADLLRYIRAMDCTFLEHVLKKHEPPKP